MNLPMTDVRVISVVTMSVAAARRLRAAPSNPGQVHSVFEHALNLDWHDGRLLTLHGPGPLLAPFAAALTHFPTDAVRPGRRVRRRDDTITLDGIVVEWSGAATVDTRMPAASGGRQSVTTLLSVVPDVGSGSAGLSSTIGRRAQSRLAEGLRLRQSEVFIEGALGLLGLGEGLTPSGDDCLVGALAVVHRFARSLLNAYPEIESVVGAASAIATNTIAREFVTHALAGQFSESLIDLMSSQSAEDIERAVTHLLRTGATSGADTLHGIRLALCALWTQRETSA
jgi:hypothetical protein